MYSKEPEPIAPEWIDTVFSTESSFSGSADGELTFGVLNSDADPRAMVASLVRANDAELLAAPYIVTLENKKASVLIGEEVPFKVGSVGTAFREVGLHLDVTPRITNDGHIIIELLVRSSELIESNDAGPPTIDTREMQATLRTKNGQTVFLIGAHRIGAHRDDTDDPSELVMFIKSEVIDPSVEETSKAARTKSDLRRP